jgi:hypothetical protein
MEEESIP